MSDDIFTPTVSRTARSSATLRQARLTAWAAAALVAVIVAIPQVHVTLGRGVFLLATGQLAQFQQYLRSLGAWAPVASIGLMIVEALAVPLPATIIIVANGLAFGVWRGALVSAAGGAAGALIAYAIGRFVGRTLLERIVPVSNVQWADQFMTKYGKWAIVLERWIPGVPGDPVSYVAGITRVPTPTFLALTMIGLLPANLAAAYLGAQLAGDVPMRYWASGLLLAATVYAGWRTAGRHRRRR